MLLSQKGSIVTDNFFQTQLRLSANFFARSGRKFLSKDNNFFKRDPVEKNKLTFSKKKFCTRICSTVSYPDPVEKIHDLIGPEKFLNHKS